MRRLTALLIGGTLAVAANLPPQHGHPSRAGHAAVVHRHASLHVTGDASHPRLCDNDGLIIWIDGSFLPGASAVPAPVDVALPEPILRTPVIAAQRAMLDAQASSIHGPPRQPSGSRAPPFQLAL